MKNNVLNFDLGYQPKRRYAASIKWMLVSFQVLSLLLVILFQIGDLDVLSLVFAGVLILLTFLSNFAVQKLSGGDEYLLLIVNMLFSIGIIMIFRIEQSAGRRQLMMYAISIFVFFVAYLFLRKTYRFWVDKTKFFYMLTVAFFVVTLVFGFTQGGAKNWIEVFGFRMQPSEFAKIPFVFYIASYYRNYERSTKCFFGKYTLMVCTYFLIGLFFLQKELGTAIVFFLVLMASQFAFEPNKKLIFLNLFLAIIGLTAAYFLFAHVRVRFDIWRDPWSDINNKGYQITQALFGLAEGGFFGTGIGLGHPNYIPLAHSDFIFASIVEEMGAFMGICVILLFLILFYRGVKICMRQSDNFYAVLALAISSLFAAQGIIMFAGVMKLIPLTGITIPFLTYGGSSLVSSFVLLAALQIASEDLELREGRHDKK